MSLLRRCRVNAAYSIQLFSQLLHCMSAWLVNWLLGSGPGLRGQPWRPSQWLETLRQRLTLVTAWAERQGLELAADCHLSLVMQVCVVVCDREGEPSQLKAFVHKNHCHHHFDRIT